MFRTTARWLVLAAMLAALGAAASAQDVIMNSAETINVGNVKLALFPTAVFGKGDEDTEFGMAGRVGLGLTPRFDIEAKGAVFEGLRYYGGDAELWLVRGGNLNISVGGGAHFIDLDGGVDIFGIDATLIASTRPRQNLEIYGGLKLAFEDPDVGENYRLVHLVPGFEYRVARDLDFLAEIGIAVNDRSRTYASVGLAYYIR